MSSERRDVRVVLDVTLGPDGTTSVRKLEEAVKSASLSQEQFWQKASGGSLGVTAPRVVGGGAQGGGGGGGGATPFGLGGFGRAFAALATFQTAMSTATSAAQIQANPWMTEELSQRKLFRDVVPFGQGKQIQEIVDALSGRSRAVALQQFTGQAQQIQVAGQTREREFLTDWRVRQAGLEERERQAGRAVPIQLNPIDRRTALGEREFREQSELLPVRRESARLEREAAAVSKERKAAEEEQGRLQAAQQSSAYTQNQLVARQGRESGAAELKRLNDLAAEEKRLTAITEQRQQLAVRIADLKRQEAQATAAVRAQEAQSLEVRARIAEQRAGTSASAAERLGRMDPFERQQSLQAFKIMQQYGPDALPPELKQYAEAFAPEESRKLYEARGAKTAEFAEGRRLAPVTYAGEPEKLRQEAESLRQQAEVARVQNEANVAKASADAGRDLGAFVAAQMKVVVESAVNQLRVEFKTATQAGG